MFANGIWLELLKSHLFLVWICFILFSLSTVNSIIGIIWKKGLSDLPGAVKLVVAVVVSAALTPLFCEAAHQLLNGEPPANDADNPWGLTHWPAEGVAGFIGAFAGILAYWLWTFWEPTKDEVLARAPSWVEYGVTWLLGAAIYGASLALVTFMVSVRCHVPFFTPGYLALFALMCAGPTLVISLGLRTLGIPRVMAELVSFTIIAVGTYGIASLDGWVPEATIALLASSCIWVVHAVVRAVIHVTRTRQAADYSDGVSSTPPPFMEALSHRCKICSREFLPFRGLRIHQGRTHKSADSEAIAVADL